MQEGRSDGSHGDRGERGAGVSDAEAARLWEAFCRQGNLSALQRLYDTFHPQAVRYCRSVFGDAHLAEDAVQTAFARLLSRRPALKSNFRHLLLTTARNICRDELRKRRRQPDPASVLGDATDPPDPLEKQEDVAALRDCLMQLAERDRSLVILTAGEGHSNRAAAETLDWKAADHTVSRRLKSIRSRLLRCLQKKGIFRANSR